MTELIKTVTTVVGEEYVRAAAKFGPTNNSDHESYGIILEELEEASDEMNRCFSALERVWHIVKHRHGIDSEKLKSLNLVYQNAILGACELIQVAAMAYKAQKTIEERNQK